MTAIPEPAPALIALKALGVPTKAMTVLLDMEPRDFANRAMGRLAFTVPELIVLGLYPELIIESTAKRLNRGGLAPEVADVIDAHARLAA